MTDKKDWIDKCLLGAKKANILVTDDAATSMKSLLESVLCERSLRSSELTEIATVLLSDMETPASTNAETNDEN